MQWATKVPQPEVLNARTNPANNLMMFFTLWDLSGFKPAAVNAFQQCLDLAAGHDVKRNVF